MDEVTVALGTTLRDFQEKTCSAYDTKELSREADARRKRWIKTQTKEAAKDKMQTSSETTTTTANPTGESQPNHNVGEAPPQPPATRKRKRSTKSTRQSSNTNIAASTLSDRLTRLKKSLNLNTYKNHSLGDYTETIRRYGTTDSYSTEAVNIIFSKG